MEWTVGELAERAGVSARTLRHYHRIGLVEPDRIGSTGYRYYGPDAVARLQRVLLLRQTGMPLAAIAAALDARETPAAEIVELEAHLRRLQGDSAALDARIRAVEHTLGMRRSGRAPRMDAVLEGFNDRYEDEVVRRWGREAFDASNRWWHGKSVRAQRDWQASAEGLIAGWARIRDAGHAPDAPAAQQHAAAHLEWFAAIPGTPAHAGDADRTAAMVRGIAERYATEPAFHAAFGSPEAARFAADALRIHMQLTR